MFALVAGITVGIFGTVNGAEDIHGAVAGVIVGILVLGGIGIGLRYLIEEEIR